MCISIKYWVNFNPALLYCHKSLKFEIINKFGCKTAENKKGGWSLIIFTWVKLHKQNKLFSNMQTHSTESVAPKFAIILSYFYIFFKK